MHDENQIIDRVCCFLKSAGLCVTERRYAHQRSYDIEAVTATGQRVVIEAKGGTRTRQVPGNPRKPFSPGSVYTAVTTAYFCASTYGPKGYLAGIALQGNDAFRSQTKELLPSLKALGIELFWVDSAGNVSVQGHWDPSILN